MVNETPVVLLAFANARGDLHTLRDEQRELQELFETLQQSGHCRVVFRPDITLEQLFKALQEDRERLVLFHYGGHAREDRLMFDSGTGESPAFAGGLATLLGQCRGLKVVFLNGCSTGPQVKALLDARVPAVIATARPIRDAVARDLAVAFYKALTTGDRECRIDRGQNLVGAFEAAKGFVSTAEGTNRSNLLDAGRDLGRQDVSDLTGMPWDLYPSEPPTSVARWTLFEKDPYFGLPGIPEDIPLPPKPFIHLEHFQRKHAPVFFGRGKAIRVLYDLIRNPASPRVILYYGPTGVGKSSVLDAGLLPRLERTHEVVYCRRDESHGLLGTLRRAFGGDDQRPLVELWTERETSTGRPLVVVVDQVEEAFTRPIAIDPDANEEDALERPWTDPDAELRAFALALRELFGGAVRPRGQAFIAFRNERLQEVRAAFDAVLLKVAEVPLAPLARHELIEIIQGPCAITRYNLNAEEGLADHIADELGKNGEAREAVAPTLQVLLSRMYAEFPDDPLSARTLSFELYRHLKTSGLLLKDFLDLGLNALLVLGQEEGDAVRSGLVLDVLMEYTTEWGTAKALRQEELRERFPEKRGEAVSRLADRLEGLYLLSRPGQSASQLALAHDTLAPVVRHAHQLSIAPAQRARRLLENKSPEWKDGADGTVLDPTQLAAVEEGLSAMRRMMPDEQRLVVASREHEKRIREEESERKRRVEEAENAAREAKEGRLRSFRRAAVALAAAFVLTLTAAGVAVVLWNSQAAAERARGVAEKAELKEKAALAIAEEARREAEVARRELAQLNYIRQMDLAHREWQEGNVVRALALLQETNTAPRRWEWGHVNRLCHGYLLDLKACIQTDTKNVALTPDGKRLAAPGDDHSVNVWDPQTGELIGSFRVHSSRILSIAFSPDGRRIVSSAEGHPFAVKVWDAHTGKMELTLQGHTNNVGTACFSSDGQRIATGSYDNTAKLWDAKTGAELLTLRGPSQTVRCLAFSPDGRRIATARGAWENWNMRQEVQLWDTQTGEQLRTLKGHTRFVSHVVFSPDGKLLASASLDETIRVWDAETGQALRSLKGHNAYVWCANFSADGKRIVSGGEDLTVKVWDAQSGRILRTSLGHTKTVRWAAFGLDGKRIYSASNDGTIKVWDADGSTGATILRGHDDSVFGVAISPDSKSLASASADRLVKIWDLTSNREMLRLKGHARAVSSVGFSPDGKRLVSGSWDQTVKIWNAQDGQLIRTLSGHTGIVQCVVFSPDGRRVVSASRDKTVRVWDAETGESILTLQGHSEHVYGVTYSPDAKYIVSAARDKTARVWDAGTGAEVLRLNGHDSSVWKVAFSRDGLRLVTAGGDATVRVWDALTGRELRCLRGHTGLVFDATFSPDGDRVASVGAVDGMLKIWDVRTGQPIISLRDHSSHNLNCIVFSPDGQRLASGSNDKTVRVRNALWEH